MNNTQRVANFHVNLIRHILLLMLPLCILICGGIWLYSGQTVIPGGALGATLAVIVLYYICSIWHFIWIYRTTDQLNAEKVDQARNPLTKMLLCMFLPFYFVFWYDQSAKRTDAIAQNCGLKSGLRTVYDAASITLGSIAVLCLMSFASVTPELLNNVIFRIILGVLAAAAITAFVLLAIAPILLQAKLNKVAATGAEMPIRGLRRKSRDDLILYAVTDVILMLLLLIVAYPIIYVISCSFSSGAAVSTAQVILWPVEFSLTGYKVVFHYGLVWIGFANSIFYTVVGTIVNMVLSVLAAYPLSRPHYQGHKFCMTLFTVMMIFNAGLIPRYLLMSSLGLTNTRWALILYAAISAQNMIIIRTYFKNSIPSELIEAARIDGSSELRILWEIVLPLSKAVLSVVTLYYAVAHWNSYFAAVVYLRDRRLQPLQIVLRDILNASRIDLTELEDPTLATEIIGAADLVKYALIVISSAPVIAAYPFVQKFFKKGVMIGSVKG